MTSAPPADRSAPRAPIELSVSELARLKGVTRQTIAERLSRLEEQGLIVSRRGPGKVKLIRLAEWDTVTNEHSDLSKLAAAETRRAARGAPDDPVAKRDPTYNAELTRKAGFEADLKEIELRRLRGDLLPRSDVQRTAEVVAEKLVRILDQIPAFADDLAAALSREGIPGMRTALKVRMREVRNALAVGMAQLAAASSDDEPEEDDAEQTT